MEAQVTNNSRGGGRFGQRFDRYKGSISNSTAPARRTECTNTAKMPPPPTQQINHASGGRFERYEGNGVKCIDWDVAPKQEFFDELFRVAKTVIIWGGNYFPLPPTRCFIVWDKQQPEKFSMAMCEYAWTNMNANAKIFRMKPQGDPKDPRFHPTQKPVALYAWLLRNYAKEGDTIIKPLERIVSSDNYARSIEKKTVIRAAELGNVTLVAYDEMLKA